MFRISTGCVSYNATRSEVIQDKHTIALEENIQWKPAVAYCRYADFLVIVKCNKQQAEVIRDQCRIFLGC